MRSKCIWGIEKISKEENYPPSKRILGIEEDVKGSSYPSGKRWQSNFWRREKHKRKSLSVGKKMAREFLASREAQKEVPIRREKDGKRISGVERSTKRRNYSLSKTWQANLRRREKRKRESLSAKAK